MRCMILRKDKKRWCHEIWVQLDRLIGWSVVEKPFEDPSRLKYCRIGMWVEDAYCKRNWLRDELQLPSWCRCTGLKGSYETPEPGFAAAELSTSTLEHALMVR